MRTALLATMAAMAILLLTSQARASLQACGNINVSAGATCTVEADPPTCQGRCDEASFQASCQGYCDVALPSCSGSCYADCQGGCNVDPGNFDCNVDCQGRCEADCDAACASSGNQSDCRGRCSGDCSGMCSASCSGTPPSANCDARCEASCEGACTGGHAACEGSCQGEFKANCHLKCTEGSGAVFCDGEYVDSGNNLEQCLDALRSIGATVNFQGYASGECSGNTCVGDAGCSIFSTVPASRTSSWPMGFGALGAVAGVGALVGRRLRARARRGASEQR
jgi:hypothetical protein